MLKFTTTLSTLILLLTLTISSNAQNQRICGHDHVLESVRDHNPEFDAAYDLILQEAQRMAEANRGEEEDTVYTIQVVFHILYEADDPYQYISDELVQSQLDALNRDFNKLNDDFEETRDIFKPFAGDTKVKFVLAQKLGDQCKNAIVRKQWVAPNAFLPIFTDFLLKENEFGGSSAWNTNKYLNIWVANLNKNSDPATGFLGGYAYLPGLVETGLAKVHDGVAIDFRFFGQDNPYVEEVQPGFAIYTKGRTTVHEVGHWFGLRHIWGDLGTLIPEQGCDADDGIDDTPNARQPYSVHGFCEDTIVNSCIDPENDLPDMFENYMDYSTDVCNSMFTQGQVDVMRFILSDYRSDLQHNYDYPTTSEVSNEVEESSSIEVCFELEDCFGFANVNLWPCGTGSGTTSASTDFGSFELIDESYCLTYTPGSISEDQVDEFCVVAFDEHLQMYDTVEVVIDISNVDLPSAIELDQLDNDIEVFPNPARGAFVVRMPGLQQETSMTIYNNLGKVVWEEQLQPGTDWINVQMDNPPAGVYMIHFSSDDMRTFEKVMLK